MKTVRYIFLLLLSSWFSFLHAQVLLPEQALEKAFKNNPDLQSAEKMKSIAAINNTMGRAGGLPQVSLLSGWNTATQNANLTFNNGSEVSRKGAGSSAFNGNVQAGQLLFGGFMVQARKQSLKWEETAANEAYRLRKSLLREQVLNAYYKWVNELQWLRQMQSLDSFFSLKTAQVQLLLQNGKATELDLLQARADEAAQKAKTLDRMAMLSEALASLNLLMNEPADRVFTPAVTEMPENFPLPDTSEAALLKSNSELSQKKAEWEAMKQNRSMAKSAIYPTLSAQANTNLLNSRSDVGLLLKNQTTASSVGLNLSYNLFNGGNIRKDIQMTSFRVSMAEIAYNKALLEAKSNIFIAIKRWSIAQQQAALQKQAMGQYREILEISQKAFSLGKYNRVELSQAQMQYETALSALMQTQFTALQYYHVLQRLLGVE